MNITRFIEPCEMKYDDVDGNGYYDVNDFLKMKNEEILKENNGKKWDVILSNPPYTGILHMKFLEKFIQIISDNGNIIQISPNIFLKHILNSKAGNYRNMLEGNLKDIDIIKHDEANSIFNLGHSINELAIYHIQKNTKNPIDIKLFGFENKIERNIFEKLVAKRDGKLGWENKNTKRHGEQKGYFVNLYTWHIGHNAYTTCINESNKFSRTVYFDNEIQVKNFKESFNTNFMEYYCREIVWAGNGITDKCFMLDKEYYNKPINDKFFFKFFDINKEEQEYILNKVRNYDK